MKHSFRGSIATSNGEVSKCLICSYDEVSHGNKATCEACGLEGECDFLPDEKHPKKMLLCLTCFERDRKAMAVYNARVQSVPVRENIVSVYQVRTSGEYFNANIPAIVDIQKAIEADDKIENKKYEEAKQVKDRLTHLTKSLFEMDAQRSTLANEQRETQVYLHHLMKDLSEEKQHELGLKDITYTQTKSPKKVSAPKVKSFDKVALKDASVKHNIPEYMLQSIVTSRKVSIEEAIKVYHQVMAKSN